MPIGYRILPVQRLVHTWTTGGVTDAEMAAHRRQLRADPMFQPDFDQLIECLGVTPSAISRGAVSKAVHESVFSLKSRRAIVAVKDASFGVGRMFSLMQPEGAQVEVFREIGPALKWLGHADGVLGNPADRANLESAKE